MRFRIFVPPGRDYEGEPLAAVKRALPPKSSGERTRLSEIRPVSADFSTRLEAAYQTALAALVKERHPDGYWVGELSTSALSTATAVSTPGVISKR